ncbi:DUF6057 family protein [Parabacteroides sp. GYB001]|nr:DUF6057 family protein [Parabacteroides leei]
MFYMAEQHSLFVFDRQVMQFILNQPFGEALCTGRFLLLSFHEPILGGMLLSLILTATVCLLKYIFSLQGKWECFSLLPSILVIWYLVQKGSNLYYQQEPSVVFLWPVALLLCTGVIAILKRCFLKKEKPKVTPSNRFSWGISVLLFATLYIYGWTGKENERLTATSQRLMQEQDWNSMIEIAQKAKHPTRSVAAYHAIALLQTNQLLTRLFEIPYQYPDPGLINRGGQPDDGTDLYLADCCFATGLFYQAYHQAMERMVIDGPNCYTLKQLFFCSLLNEEYVLANKYLYLLMQVPTERGFVRKYMPLVANPEKIMTHPYFSKILELVPMEDHFEQEYRSPVFVGYNVQITNARNLQAFEVSLAACLYTKMLPETFNRTRPYAGKQLPPLVEQAIVLYSLTSNADILKYFKINPQTISRVKEFVTRYVRNGSVDPDNFEELRKEYSNFYPYYFYCENIINETDMAKYQSLMKGGVN